jgi:asparagine synthase (glutamine-hydrolysing)
MYHSIESRVPLLDNELVDFVLRMPAKFKLHNGRKKRLLKDAMSDVLPKEVLRGRKRGFDVPFKKWLKDDLFDFALQKVSESSDNIFNKAEITALLYEHKDGKADHGMLLWKLLVLMSWLQQYEEKLIW